MAYYPVKLAVKIIDMLPFDEVQRVDAYMKLYQRVTGIDLKEILDIEEIHKHSYGWVKLKEKCQPQNGATGEADNTLNMF